MTEPSLKARAIRHLARREHSRSELALKLKAHGSPEEIDEILERMTELGLLSDRRMANAWVRVKAGRFGDARLRHDLARHGIDRETVEASLETGDIAPEMDRARAARHSKFGQMPENAKEWARQARFLQSRGFAPDIIRKLLNGKDDESA